MSGVKRRSKYRKNVTQDVLYNFPEPTENQGIGQIQRSLGSNLLQILYLNTTTQTMEEGIARLPTKFRKLVWVKRGDYIIASVAEGDIETSTGGDGKVKYTVEHILYADQIKHLQKQNLWPNQFPTSTTVPLITTNNDNNTINTNGNDDDNNVLINVSNLTLSNNSSSSSTVSTTVLNGNVRNSVGHQLPRADSSSEEEDSSENSENGSSSDDDDDDNHATKEKIKKNRKPQIQFGRPGELPPSYDEYEEEG